MINLHASLRQDPLQLVQQIWLSRAERCAYRCPCRSLKNLGILRPHKVETAFCSHCGMSKPIHSSFKSTVIFRTKTYEYKILLAATCTEIFILFILCLLPHFEKFSGIHNHGPPTLLKNSKGTRIGVQTLEMKQTTYIGKFLF